MNIAQILIKEPFEYRKLLQQNLRTGMSFPAARSSALIRYMREKATSVHNTFGVSSEHIELILSSPNNILGIEYCKALLRLNSRILPHALLRKGCGYHDTDFSLLSDEEFPSASGIRSLMKKSEGTVQSADLSRLIPSASLPGFLDSLKKEHGFLTQHWIFLCITNCFWNPKKL
mgnify:CR=1 FL=1